MTSNPRHILRDLSLRWWAIAALISSVTPAGVSARPPTAASPYGCVGAVSALAGSHHSLSPDTVAALSEMMSEGGGQESRDVIRRAQDLAMAERFQSGTSTRLENSAQKDLFIVAPVDIMVSEDARGQKQFHPLELNGTGIAGLTNMPDAIVSAVLQDFTELGEAHAKPGATVLVAFSGKEDPSHPRISKTIYEKALYAEALQRGMERRGMKPQIVALSNLRRSQEVGDPARPMIVLGYIGEILDELSVQSDGSLHLPGRQVTLAINDRFCLNVVDRFAGKLDLDRLATSNRGFLAGADKSMAYELFNEYVAKNGAPFFTPAIRFDKARTREQLIDLVTSRLAAGRDSVIKPRGTGLGHGIKIFRRGSQDHAQVVREIDASLKLTDEFYRVKGGALPYTVSDFVDGAVIDRPDHPKFGHKYELRVVVYREGMELKAFPSIVKISGTRYDPRRPDAQDPYINNIGAGMALKNIAGTDLMLPLANKGTMDLLGLTPAHMQSLSTTLTGFVGYVLHEVQHHPERFGLPETKR